MAPFKQNLSWDSSVIISYFRGQSPTFIMTILSDREYGRDSRKTQADCRSTLRTSPSNFSLGVVSKSMSRTPLLSIIFSKIFIPI